MPIGLSYELLMALDLLQQQNQHQSYISSLSTTDGAMAHGGLGMQQQLIVDHNRSIQSMRHPYTISSRVSKSYLMRQSMSRKQS